MGTVHLTVGDLGRSLDYYRRAIGLDVLEQADGEATLGSGGEPLLHLSELPEPRPLTATRASFISRCSFRSGSTSRAGSRTPRGSACP